MNTQITVDVESLKGTIADCSFSAHPPVWPCRWVHTDGQINAPWGANEIEFNLPLNLLSYRFAGIKICNELGGLQRAPIHRRGPIEGTPFTVALIRKCKTLRLRDAPGNWRGWHNWAYSIGITDGSNLYWCDPMIYNKGDG